MGCFVCMFASLTFQCCFMCLWRLKKKRFRLMWPLLRRDQVTELCRELKHKPAKHFLWHAACGCLGVKHVYFHFTLPFVLGKTVLKILTVVPVFFLFACCFLFLPRCWASQGVVMGWNQAGPWLVTQSSYQSRSVSWCECCLQSCSPAAANPSKQHCHLLPLN